MELITGQLWYVGASFLWGAVLMFVYDFILAFRGTKKHSIVRLLLEDWVFWGIAAIFVFQMIFALNDGMLRSFFVIAFLLGMTGYRKLVKKRVQKAIRSFVSFMLHPYHWIKKKLIQKELEIKERRSYNDK